MPVPDEWNLEGKVALLTADQRGWTPYLAAALAEAGAQLAIFGDASSDANQAYSTVIENGGSAVEIKADITNNNDIESAINQTVNKFGALDILVNNAQLEFGKPFSEVSEEEWLDLMNFNVTSLFRLCKSAGKVMNENGGGRIINISSGLAVRGLWNSVPLCTAYGAVHQFTSSLALEWAHRNIRVNGIGAGWFSTDRSTASDESELLIRYLPLRRKGHPEDLAGLLIYLSSNASDFVTGQTIFIDGGALAHA
jgi:NAD(P)-dependent dehydrogenase (short-subunit alcohol dehydrogenase family)